MGSVQISIEIELGWGYHDLSRDSRRLSPDRSEETRALKRILLLCDQLEIPVTFNIVGHLLFDSCTGVHDIQYPEGWLSSDPGSDIDSAPLFYAPDLVSEIKESDMGHEICTHTFTHVLCDEINESVLQADLEYAQSLHREVVGKQTRSLVPPRHRQVPYEVLHDCGIKVVRQTVGEIPRNPIQRLMWYFRRKHPVVEPQKKGEMIISYTSPVQSLTAPFLPSGQQKAHPVFRTLPMSWRKRTHSKYISDALGRATLQGSHAHFWTHLHDMANEEQLDVVEDTLQQVSTAVNAGSIKVDRMCDLWD